MSQQRFAAFDLDGTLIRWQLYHALADRLVHDGFISQESFQHIKQARMAWKNRIDSAAFKSYEHALVELVDSAMTSISVEAFDVAVVHVINEYKAQTYTYTRRLIQELKTQHYLLFAISASQAQLVGRIAEAYGFDDFAGSMYKIKDGRFTGEKHVIKGTQKPIELEKLAVKHHATWEGSIAVGDSESDIPMLTRVDQPIAMNPTAELFDHAQQQGWKVVVERKNMIYELEQRDGTYVLAQTNS